MQTEVALRNVAATAADLLQLLMAARPRRHSGADRVAIALRPNEHDQDPITVFETCLTLGIFGTFGRIPCPRKCLTTTFRLVYTSAT